jgi:hypothetical protein
MINVDGRTLTPILSMLHTQRLKCLNEEMFLYLSLNDRHYYYYYYYLSEVVL